MTYYLIREKMTATDENPNFAGDRCTYYVGKGDEILCMVDHNEPAAIRRNKIHGLLRKWHIREYGYTRRCDAARNWSYNNPQNDKNWTTEAEIITVKA